MTTEWSTSELQRHITLSADTFFWNLKEHIWIRGRLQISMISPTEQYSNSVRTTHPLQPNIREVQIIDFHIGPRKNFLVSHFIPIFYQWIAIFLLTMWKNVLISRKQYDLGLWFLFSVSTLLSPTVWVWLLSLVVRWLYSLFWPSFCFLFSLLLTSIFSSGFVFLVFLILKIFQHWDSIEKKYKIYHTFKSAFYVLVRYHIQYT